MKTKIILTVLAAAVLSLVVAGVFFKNAAPISVKQIAAAPAAIVQPEPSPVAASVEPAPVAESPATIAETPAAKLPETKSMTPVAKKHSQPKATAAASKEPIQDPSARAALSFVGADADAEAYWVDAINDSSLPANERKDLIEDLNEDGLSDPKHPGAEDLPLILNRISLIERLAPSAMDQVNADAFAEAYKDLVNLAAGNGAQ